MLKSIFTLLKLTSLIVLISCDISLHGGSDKKSSKRKKSNLTRTPSSDFCQIDPEETDNVDFTSKVMIGDSLDWYDRDQINQLGEKINSQAVGHLYLPHVYASCTAFLINEDTIMTNNHCVNTQKDLQSSTFSVWNSNGVKENYNCSQFVYTNPRLDYTLIKCEGSPGKEYGYLALSDQQNIVQSDIYVVQANCNYVDDARCSVDRYVSYGTVVDEYGNKVSHNADTLPGSSGSPILDKDSQAVISIHNAGSPNAGNGEGMNYGISMTDIKADIGTNASHIEVYDNISQLDGFQKLPVTCQ